MQRTNMIKARKEAGLTQKQVAQRMGGIRQATVSAWETGQEDPYPLQIPLLRAILKSNAPDLFDIQTGVGPVKGFKELMEMLRRQFIEALAQIGGIALFGNVNLALVSSPVVEPDEYLAQCAVAIDACWEWLGEGSLRKVERALQVNMPTLARLTNTIAPYQALAANLAVQAKLMLSILAQNKLDYFARETHCVDAVHFAQLSGNRTLLAIALDWQGMTYVHCFRQPERAIPLFNTALSSLDNDALLEKSALYIDLSVAYAQDTTQENYETKARDYAEKAHMAMPAHPELDPFYQLTRMGKSELEQAEGKMYLYLAEQFPNNGYGLLAYDAFNNATSKESMSLGYRSQALIRKADSARVIGQMGEMVTCLSDGLLLVNNKKRLREISDVLNGIPDEWRKETPVIALQKELAHTITVTQ